MTQRVNSRRVITAARRLDAAWDLMANADDDTVPMEQVVAAIGELRAALDAHRAPSSRVGRIDPAVEAGALMAEWVSSYRLSDRGWRKVYTGAEVEAVDAELDLCVAQLPRPGRSLFFRDRRT